MSRAGRSVNVFATYLIVLSVALLVAPNLLLETFALAPTSEVWIRVVGMLVAFLGIYYGVAARMEATAFFRATVMVRLSVPVFFLLFVLAGWAAWPLLIFAGVDLAGAVWTWAALRSEGV
jgi:hypothetical protein